MTDTKEKELTGRKLRDKLLTDKEYADRHFSELAETGKKVSNDDPRVVAREKNLEKERAKEEKRRAKEKAKEEKRKAKEASKRVENVTEELASNEELEKTVEAVNPLRMSTKLRGGRDR